MRENKFRGKSKETGLWIFGDLIQTLPYKDGHIHCWIKSRDILGMPGVSVPMENFIEVIPESVGQYTGLKDKRGVGIYEGDIVKYLKTAFGTEDWSEPIVIVWNEGNACFDFLNSYNGLIYNKYEVIGNVFENKDLLDNLSR